MLQRTVEELNVCWLVRMVRAEVSFLLPCYHTPWHMPPSQAALHRFVRQSFAAPFI
jgi:hypothetical protein